YMKMLNKLLEERKLPNIKAGIGLAAKETLAVKAGRKSSGINNLVWIGDAVTHASKLSDLGNKPPVEPIVMSKIFYNNYIKEQMKNNENAKNWWKVKNDLNLGDIYHGNVIIGNFNDWINNGMNETN
ncbi:adenylate cyclase, partial [Bacillus altitudinis]